MVLTFVPLIVIFFKSVSVVKFKLLYAIAKPTAVPLLTPICPATLTSRAFEFAFKSTLPVTVFELSEVTAALTWLSVVCQLAEPAPPNLPFETATPPAALTASELLSASASILPVTLELLTIELKSLSISPIVTATSPAPPLLPVETVKSNAPTICKLPVEFVDIVPTFESAALESSETFFKKSAPLVSIPAPSR